MDGGGKKSRAARWSDVVGDGEGWAVWEERRGEARTEDAQSKVSVGRPRRRLLLMFVC